MTVSGVTTMRLSRRPWAGKPEPEDAVLGPERRPRFSPLQDDELLAKSQILDDQVGLGDKNGPEDGDDDPEDEHQHLVCLRLKAKGAVY